MRRYWLPRDSFQGQQVALTGEVFKHICVVCRQGVGDRFEVITDQKAFFVELLEVGKKNALAKILEERKIPQLPKPEIHLALSTPKFQTVDKVIEKMVELGVVKVHLFSSDFSFVKSQEDELEKKINRWRKIVQGATQQTGRGELMGLTGPTPLSVLLETHFSGEKALGLLAYEGEGGEPLAHRLKGLPQGLDQVWVFVGAEGGFSAKDLELFAKYELLPLSLGDQVLRVETACVTLVSILKYGLGHYN